MVHFNLSEFFHGTVLSPRILFFYCLWWVRFSTLAQQFSHRGCKKSSFTGPCLVCLQKESCLKFAWIRKHFPSKNYIRSYRSDVSSSQNKWLTPSHWQREKSQLTEPCLDGWLADPVGLISSDLMVDLATKQKKVSPCYFVDGALLSSQIKTCVHILSSLNYIHHFIHQLTHHTSQFSAQTIPI